MAVSGSFPGHLWAAFHGRLHEILAAAQRVFARNGYRGSSVPMIIKESGLSAGAIYSYFDGKEVLFRAVVERTLELKSSQFASDPDSDPRSPGELMQQILQGMQGEPILTIAPQIWAEAAVEPEIRAVLSQVFERLTSMLRTELTAWADTHPDRTGADPQAWAARITPVLFSAIPGFILQRLTLDDFDEQAYLDALIDTYPH